MKKNILLATLFFALPAYADDLPQRKAGLWELSVSGAQGMPGQVMKQCIDGSTDTKMMQMGTEMAGKMGAQCQTSGVKKVGEQYVNESTCQMGPTKIVSKSVFSGDFSKEYSGETTATYEPPLMGTKSSSSKISAKWLGECEAGQVPGDMVMPGGMKMNINQMGMLKGMAEGMAAQQAHQAQQAH